MKELNQTQLILFKQKILKRSQDKCWDWLGFKTKTGYGRYTYNKTCEYAHRIMCFLDGRNPTGYEVMHTCDNPSCVNPAHLRLGTHSENMKDCHSKGRSKNVFKKGQKSVTQKLTPYEVESIFAMKLLGEKSPSISRKLNVSKSLVVQILARKIWKKLPVQYPTQLNLTCAQWYGHDPLAPSDKTGQIVKKFRFAT